MNRPALDIFLKQRRFDLIFKYLYVKYPNNQFIKHAYLENIRAFNNFYEVEPSDGLAKNSPEQFISSFDQLIQSIQVKGFNKSDGVIPIGDNGEISDGAHRLAVCAYLNKSVELEKDGRSDLYDYKFFLQRHMDPSIMDYGALEYVKLNPYAYIVNLHSVIDPKEDSKVEKILNTYGFIYYKKNINISFNGYVNLKKLSYGSFWEKEPWIGTPENKFAGAQQHATQSIGNNPLRVFVFVCDHLDKVKQAKAEIRDLFNIGNYSIHINDSRQEAIWLAQTYFNNNSLEMINRRPFTYEDPSFDELINQLKEVAAAHQIDIVNVCGAGSTPLNVVGIRKSQDLDFLYDGPKQFNIQTDTLSNHDGELKYYPYDKKTIIENPSYHFYYHGLKFITLDVLYNMKKKRGEKPKDIKDCRAIKRLKKYNPNKEPFKFFKKIKSPGYRTIILFNFIKITYKRGN